jgi:hypothetical protein
MTKESYIEKAIKEAESLGKYHGENAAQWVAQDSWGGRVASSRQSEENARAFLKGIEEGDPMIMDSYTSPNLSGEWADSMTPRSLIEEVTQGEIMLTEEEADAVCQAYETESANGFWQELETSAAIVADNSGLPSED